MIIRIIHCCSVGWGGLSKRGHEQDLNPGPKASLVLESGTLCTTPQKPTNTIEANEIGSAKTTSSFTDCHHIYTFFQIHMITFPKHPNDQQNSIHLNLFKVTCMD